MANLPKYNFLKIENTKVETPEITIKSTKNYKNENELDINDSMPENISISFDNENIEPKKKWHEKIWDGIKSTGSTIVIGTTTVMSGIADIGEAAVDGATWFGGKVVEGGSWVVGETAGIFNKDVKQDIMDWRDDAKTNVRDFISTDWVDEANKAFYEGNILGQYINDNSYLKYDSETAQKIEGISNTVGELAIATGATIITGGVAAPFVCGTLVGIGESAETMYQLNPESSPLTEVIILGTGGLNGISWAANGKLGASFTKEIGKSLGEVGVKETATNLTKSFTKPEFLKSWLKRSLTDKGNYISSAMMSTDDLIGFMTGEKEVNAENATLLGIEFLKNFGLNTLEDGVRLGIGGFKAPSTEEAVVAMKANKVDDLEPTQNIPVPEGEEITQELPKVGDLEDTLELFPIDGSSNPQITPTSSLRPDPVIPQEVQSILDNMKTTSPQEYARYQTQIKDLATKFNVSEAEMQALLDAKITELLTNSEFGSRVSVDTLNQILDSGYLKNQFETGTSGGALNPMARKLFERELFGVPDDLESSQKPIYGMAFPTDSSGKLNSDYIENGPGYWYGRGSTKTSEAVVIFDKSKISSGTSFTIGDSLDYGMDRSDYSFKLSGSTVNEPTFKGGMKNFLSGISSLEELKNASLVDIFSGSRGDEYLELQIHGQSLHSIDYVSKVLFKSPPSIEIISKLQNLGISWGLIN